MKTRKILLGICAILTLLIVAFFYDNTSLSVSLLIVVSLAMMFLDGNKRIFFLFLTTGILGALSEALAVKFGAWEYKNVFFIGIPLYLPFLWGNAGIFIKALSRKYNN